MLFTEGVGKTCEIDEKGSLQGQYVFTCRLWRGGCTTFHQLKSTFQPGEYIALGSETVSPGCDGKPAKQFVLRVTASRV